MFKKMFSTVSFLIAFLLNTSAFATSNVCQTLASGVYTATANTAWVGIPAYAKNAIYYTSCTTVTGTTPNMTAAFQQSPDATLATSGGAVLSRSSVTAASSYLDPYVTSGEPQTLLEYQRVALTISGTTPSFTCTFKICYSDR